MARRSTQKKPKEVRIHRHQEKRRNVPTAEYQAVMAEDDRNPIEVAYERRNRDLDPQLVWRGKDKKGWSDLVVLAPPLFIQEKMHPKVLIDDLARRTKKKERHAVGSMLDLFADFNGISEGADRGGIPICTMSTGPNRMILGDSLQVMVSLAEREGLRGKVQCIYIDPPYGIKFNSNFQWSTTSRDVKDGNASYITREPGRSRIDAGSRNTKSVSIVSQRRSAQYQSGSRRGRAPKEKYYIGIIHTTAQVCVLPEW